MNSTAALHHIIIYIILENLGNEQATFWKTREKVKCPGKIEVVLGNDSSTLLLCFSRRFRRFVCTQSINLSPFLSMEDI